MLKVYLVQGWSDYANWIDCKIVDDITQADLVLFEGGEDVSPDLYNQIKHPLTSTNFERDLYEMQIYKKAQKLNIYCLGICRGSQFLTAMQPQGKLIQHQENPKAIHKMNTIDGDIIEVTSSHHQAMYPFNMNKEDYKILGWTKNISRFHQDGNLQELNPPLECEVVWYPKTNCLCIQSHPEWQDEYIPEEKKAINWFKTTLNNFLKNTLYEYGI